MNKQEFYRITFGYADSKYYQQAVELAHLAYQHKTLGKERNIWHIATFTDNEDQIDLMAQLWRYAKHLPKHPELYGIEAWSLELYLNKKKKDRFNVYLDEQFAFGISANLKFENKRLEIL